jgi:uncharacterized SAM-binding protein YcdF (DUF218 family)/lysophospholipase L1-like esterase
MLSVIGSRPRLSAFVLGIVVAIVGQRLAAAYIPFADVLVRPLLRADTAGRADAIVVPGGGVSDACTPNISSLQRTLLASRLYQEKRSPVVVLLGGAPPSVSCSVAEVMANLARQVGVPAADIRVEEQSRTTWENAVYATPILRAMNAQRILLVTDRLHMARAESVFAHFGFTVERVSVPMHETNDDNIGMLWQAAREYGATFYYGLRDRGSASPGPIASPPAAPPGTAAVTSTIAHPQGPIVLLGASYVAGWRVNRIGDHIVINGGIGGEQSFEMVARFAKDVVEHRPRAVFIWGFINDIFRAPSNDVDAALTRAKTNLTQAIAEARRHGIEPVLATEVTIRPPKTAREMVADAVNWLRGRRAYQDRINDRVLEMNRWLRDLAVREGVLLVDVQPLLADGSGRRRSVYAMPDGSHITDAGYEVISRSVVPLLEAHLRGKK